jgi:menaquinone-dependent protoporphyrinogen oxidase
MPRILILYGTTDGHTAKVARFLADQLQAQGADVDLIEAGSSDPDPRDYCAVIVAASVHTGGYQRTVVRWARDHADALNYTPSAFISVCLGVLQKSPKVEQDLTEITNRFAVQTNWNPPCVKRVAGAVLYTRYGWLKRMAMRQIVKRAGGSTDVSRDHEYTDWEDLRSFAKAFHAMCRVIARHQAA